MSRWIDADTLRSKLMQYIGLTNGFDRAFSEAPSIDIVRCGECEHRGADYCYKHSHRVTDSDFCSYGERKEKACTFENDTEIKSCSKDSDLISRADAIEALGEEPPVWCDEDYEIAERDQWRTDIEAIKSVPSADRPRGHWIDMADFEQCSECRGTHLKEVDTYYGKAIWIKTDFCPNCGADMRGETK